MNILYLCHEPLPSTHTNTEQAVKTLAALASEADFKLKLMCPKNTLQGKNRPTDWENVAQYYGIPPDVFKRKIKTIELTIPRLIPGEIRLPYFDLKSARIARKSENDLVYTRDPLSLAFNLAAGKPAVYESYRTNLNTGVKFRWWRKYCYSHKNLAGIVTHSELARRSFIEAGIHPDKVKTIYNGGLSQHQDSPVSKEKARRKLNWPKNKNIAVYAGRVDPEKGINSLIALAGLNQDVRFMLVGGTSGSRRIKNFERRIKQLGLSNIYLVPRVPPSQISCYLSAADLLVIPPTAVPLLKYGRTVLPIKTFRYLAAGRPILAPGTPDIKEILKHGQNAFLVQPDSTPKAAAAIRELLNNVELRKKLSENAKKEALKYTWQERGKQLAAFLRQIQSRRGGENRPEKNEKKR